MGAGASAEGSLAAASTAVEAGLVSALAHTARGGDSANARMLARRLADALDVTVRQHMSVTDIETEEPVA